ncbi:MAG: hydrogen peroxide-dependent heme synthase [Ancrocorticia sp.]|uniref:hydrogen peroxide-dependent heme synthase n=1 Tax=Ancrocorticia sp. TaxID=2593684 RepID=UPI003F8F10AF
MTQEKIPVIDHSAVAEEINESINYTMYAVFREDRTQRAPGTQAAEAILNRLAAINGLTIRGWYNISGFRADADVLLWLHAPQVESLQAGYRVILEESAGRLAPTWSSVGVHRAAEFNRAHVPAFLAGEEPKQYLCVYPFVRSYDWYLLPDAERRQMLRDHGIAASGYRDVLANTVSSFALGDYEWLLAFESDDLTRIVDLMRDLRATEARRHVREEVPFFTGPRADAGELLRRALAA